MEFKGLYRKTANPKPSTRQKPEHNSEHQNYSCLLAKSLIVLSFTLLSACAQQSKLKSFYQHESRIKPAPMLTKQTLTPKSIESPCYPLEAAVHNAEGWVQLEFSVTSEGMPVAIETKDSSPEGLFEQCALEAFERWTFRLPKESSPESASGRRFQFLFQFRLDG